MSKDAAPLHALHEVREATRNQAESFRDYEDIEYSFCLDERLYLQDCLCRLQDLDLQRLPLEREPKKGRQQFQGLSSRCYSYNECRQGLRSFVMICSTTT